MPRDYTQKQFEDRCKKYGFKSEGIMGYYKLSDNATCVSVLNAGPTRRQKLAYLIAYDREVRARA